MTDSVTTTAPAAPAADSETKEPERVKVTLKERGPELPLGILGKDGELNRAMVCRAWTGVEERALGQLREDSKEDGDFLTRMIAYMYTQVGPHNFEKMEDAAKRVVVSQMFMGDALYLYMWLRTQTLGPALRTDVTCPWCKFEFDYEADLNTLEIRTAKTLDAVTWEYQLKHPFKIRGVMADGFELSPSRWSTMEGIVKSAIQNKATTKLDMIQGCVRRILGQPNEIMLTPSELDGMTKLDIESLAVELDDREIGPDLSINDKCQRSWCKRRFYVSLEWRYDSFFAVSSPSTS